MFLDLSSDVGRNGPEWSSWLGRQHSHRWHSFAIQVDVVNSYDQECKMPYIIFRQQFRKQVSDDRDTGADIEQPWGAVREAEYGGTVQRRAHRKTRTRRNCQIASSFMLKI